VKVAQYRMLREGAAANWCQALAAPMLAPDPSMWSLRNRKMKLIVWKENLVSVLKELETLDHWFQVG
jgi:hypothetical protein